MSFPQPTARWTCRALAPGGDVVLELADDDGHEWLAEGPGGEALGALEDVLAAACDDEADPAWRAEAAAALRRQLAVPSLRGHLLLLRGDGPRFHATPAANRDSIARHGLDWRRMARPGVAGSPVPEWPGTFVCDDLEGALWFAGTAREPADIWRVDVSGLWLEGAPAASDGADVGWTICCVPIAPERLALVDYWPSSSRSMGA